MIRISGVCKEFGGRKILTGVDAEIAAGETVAVIGPSGTGKSTLLRIVAGLEQADSGCVAIDCDVKRRGMVFQSFNLFGHLNVLDNVTLAQRLVLHRDRLSAEKYAHELLARVGMADRELAMPSELSGGQQQRVAIARSLAMDPKVLLFDEPTSALDPTMVGEVLDVIRSLAKSGITMMVVTHEMSFARRVADRVFYMDEGAIYESGTPSRIFESPQRPKTLEFIGQISLKMAWDAVRLLRRDILSDGRVDELEAEMLRRIAHSFTAMGSKAATRISEILNRMLADGVISNIESDRIVKMLSIL